MRRQTFRAIARACWVFGMLSALALLVGCRASLPDGATALRTVSIEGNRHVSSGDLLAAMASDPTHTVLGIAHVWWVDYGIYDPIEVQKDLTRIERYYQSIGFFEARVVAALVVPSGAREVRVQIRIDEGAPVLIGAIRETGVDALPAKTQLAVRAAIGLPVGARFDEAKYRAGTLAVQRALTDAGLAYAKAHLTVDVSLLTHEATVDVAIDAGPKCTFGVVTITGLHELPEGVVRTILNLTPGDAYTTRDLRSAQRALFALGVFDSVEISPVLADPADTQVPIRVALAESKLRRLKLGVGFLIDPVFDDLHVVAGWEDRDFLGGLRVLQLEIDPLLVLKPGVGDSTSARPGISTLATLKQPGFIEARTTGSVSASTWILPDPVDEYRTFSTRASVGVERHFGPAVNVGLFYRKGFDFPTPYGDATLPANVFTAQIGYLELLTTIDGRDNVLSPHRGSFASLSLQYAIASQVFLAGDFGDVRVQPDVRTYLPIAPGVTLALRATIGLLFARNYTPHAPGRRTPTDDDPSAYDGDTSGDTPLWRTFFSGGATSNRGYPTQYVGLRDCAAGEVGAACSQVIGGATLWEASMELRFVIGGGVSGALFLDGSDVSRDPLDIRLDYPHLSAGPGIRYMTPFGPLRVDFGWRIPGLQRIGGALDPREEPPPFNFLITGPFALHFSIGEAF
jgi:outer membrane protein insertion porin family/translocation and assembly module TamA